MRPILAALALAAALLAPPASAQDDEPRRRIVVSGEARVEAPPDRATFTAGVQAEALQAGDALAASGEAMRAVLAALEAAGVAAADLQTSQLSVDPVWEDGGAGGQPRVRGYAASNLVTVRVRDVAALGALIDTVGAAGANRVFGIAFEIAEPRAALDEARRRAVADARARAELLAEAAGVTLGQVLAIREGGLGPAPMMRAEAMADAAAPVAEGVVAVDARVEIVFAIE
jgi:hypothetical protein